MLSLLSRRQWSQMEDAPNTIAFAYSSARENNVGLGLSVVSDRVFIEQQTFAYIDFSYKLTMSDDSNLYLGLKGGGNFYRADPTDLSTYATTPDAAQRQLSRFIPNIGAGAYYS
ncbi:MAG: type IX secretion system membrane protein PorP/SprF, partial [Flavobacteriaceae bacterium]